MNDLPTDPTSFELGGLVTWAGGMGSDIGIMIELEHKHQKDGGWILWSGDESAKWSPLISLMPLEEIASESG